MSNNPHGRHLMSLLGFVGISFGAAGFGSVFTLRALDTWYRKLRKPDWTPPDWVFGPAWTTLYLQMAVSGWLVYRRTLRQPHAHRRAGQLALFAWRDCCPGPNVPIIQLLVGTQVLNGALLPAILVFILLLARDRRLMRELRNGAATNILGWGTLLLVTSAVLVLFGSQLLGGS